MMNFEKEAKAIYAQIDGADSDNLIKDGIRKAVAYLKSKKKFYIADEIEKKTKGFAF